MKICQNPSPGAWIALLVGMFVAVGVANGWF